MFSTTFKPETSKWEYKHLGESERTSANKCNLNKTETLPYLNVGSWVDIFISSDSCLIVLIIWLQGSFVSLCASRYSTQKARLLYCTLVVGYKAIACTRLCLCLWILIKFLVNSALTRDSSSCSSFPPWHSWNKHSPPTSVSR